MTQRENTFTNGIFSEVENHPCMVRMETMPSGLTELYGHIRLYEDGNDVVKLYCNSRNNNTVEIAAVRVPADNWLTERQQRPIANYFAQFQNDNIVPVLMWKPDWSIITIDMKDFLAAIDAIFA